MMGDVLAVNQIAYKQCLTCRAPTQHMPNCRLPAKGLSVWTKPSSRLHNKQVRMMVRLCTVLQHAHGHSLEGTLQVPWWESACLLMWP